MNTGRWQIIEVGNPFSSRLTADQRDFAFTAIYDRLANAVDPTRHTDALGAVKPLHGNLRNQFSYKPAAHLRHYQDLEIRIRFQVLRGSCKIFIERVAPRDEVYAKKK